MNATTLPRVLTIGEVAKSLRCSTPTIYTLIRTGQLPAIQFSTNGRRGTVRVVEEDLIAFIARHRAGGGER